MFLVLLAYFGGVLTILSPCILPVLPFVFSRSDQPFRKSGLPLLAGMGAAFAAGGGLGQVSGGGVFAADAGLATYAGAWVVRANQIGRWIAVVIFAVLGLALLLPNLAEYLSRPFVGLGGDVQGQSGVGGQAPGIGRSLLLGVSTGLLWAPC